MKVVHCDQNANFSMLPDQSLGFRDKQVIILAAEFPMEIHLHHLAVNFSSTCAVVCIIFSFFVGKSSGSFWRNSTEFSLCWQLHAPEEFAIYRADVGICTNRLIPAVLHEWREPRHPEFQERDVWSLFNSFTSAMKDGNLAELPKCMEALHGLLDVAVGLN